MGFNSFNRAGHAMLGREIIEELAALAARHGLTFNTTGGSLGTDNMVIKLQAKTNDTQAIEAEAARLFSYGARFIGLETSDYGIEFSTMNGRFRLNEINHNRPKFPLGATCLRTGRQFKFTRSIVQAVIAARPKSIANAA